MRTQSDALYQPLSPRQQLERKKQAICQLAVACLYKSLFRN